MKALFALFIGSCQPTIRSNWKRRYFEKTRGNPSLWQSYPDTQFYCDTRLKLSQKWGNGDLRHYFFEQTRWVRDNQKRLNIAFLVHEGDIVQADAPEEWAIAKEAMSILDGHVPYCLCLGNHDMGFQKSNNKYGGDIAVNRTTHFNKYFPVKNLPRPRNSAEPSTLNAMIIRGIISMRPE